MGSDRDFNDAPEHFRSMAHHATEINKIALLSRSISEILGKISSRETIKRRSRRRKALRDLTAFLQPSQHLGTLKHAYLHAFPV